MTSIKKACRKLGVQRWPYRKNSESAKPRELLALYNNAYVRKLYRKYCPKKAKTKDSQSKESQFSASSTLSAEAAAHTANTISTKTPAVRPPQHPAQAQREVPVLQQELTLQQQQQPPKLPQGWTQDTTSLINWPAPQRAWTADLTYEHQHQTEPGRGSFDSLGMDLGSSQGCCVLPASGAVQSSPWFVSDDVNG